MSKAHFAVHRYGFALIRHTDAEGWVAVGNIDRNYETHSPWNWTYHRNLHPDAVTPGKREFWFTPCTFVATAEEQAQIDALIAAGDDPYLRSVTA